MSVPSVAVFDAYGTLFDVHSAARRVMRSRGAPVERLAALWRRKQLEYSWTRTLMGRYADFWELTERALDYALAACRLDARPLRASLLESYRRLAPYADVRETLAGYRELGMRTAVFSNATPGMLREGLRAAGLCGCVDTLCSAHAIECYKPDPRVYEYAGDALEADPDAIVFHSSNAWDAAGAASCGWRTFWINRAGSGPEYAWSGFTECSSLAAALVATRARRAARE